MGCVCGCVCRKTLAIRQRCERSVARGEQAARGSSRAGRPGYPYSLDLVHSPREELLDSSTRLQAQLDAAVVELRTAREAAAERPARTAFVTFHSRAAAACAAQTLSSPNGLLWTVRPAPPPAQVGAVPAPHVTSTPHHGPHPNKSWIWPWGFGFWVFGSPALGGFPPSHWPQLYPSLTLAEGA